MPLNSKSLSINIVHAIGGANKTHIPSWGSNVYTVAAVVKEERSSEKMLIFDTILISLNYEKITVLTIFPITLKQNLYESSLKQKDKQSHEKNNMAKKCNQILFLDQSTIFCIKRDSEHNQITPGKFW